MIEDLKENKKLAMKLQDDQDMATSEISTMKKVSRIFDANSKRELSKEINYDATPRVSAFGLFVLENF